MFNFSSQYTNNKKKDEDEAESKSSFFNPLKSTVKKGYNNAKDKVEKGISFVDKKNFADFSRNVKKSVNHSVLADEAAEKFKHQKNLRDNPEWMSMPLEVRKKAYNKMVAESEARQARNDKIKDYAIGAGIGFADKMAENNPLYATGKEVFTGFQNKKILDQYSKKERKDITRQSSNEYGQLYNNVVESGLLNEKDPRVQHIIERSSKAHNSNDFLNVQRYTQELQDLAKEEWEKYEKENKPMLEATNIIGEYTPMKASEANLKLRNVIKANSKGYKPAKGYSGKLEREINEKDTKEVENYFRNVHKRDPKNNEELLRFAEESLKTINEVREMQGDAGKSHEKMAFQEYFSKPLGQMKDAVMQASSDSRKRLARNKEQYGRVSGTIFSMIDDLGDYSEGFASVITREGSDLVAGGTSLSLKGVKNIVPEKHKGIVDKYRDKIVNLNKNLNDNLKSRGGMGQMGELVGSFWGYGKIAQMSEKALSKKLLGRQAKNMGERVLVEALSDVGTFGSITALQLEGRDDLEMQNWLELTVQDVIMGQVGSRALEAPAGIKKALGGKVDTVVKSWDRTFKKMKAEGMSKEDILRQIRVLRAKAAEIAPKVKSNRGFIDKGVLNPFGMQSKNKTFKENRTTNLYAGQNALNWQKSSGKFSNLADKKARFEIDDSKAKLRDINYFGIRDKLAQVKKEMEPLNEKLFDNIASKEEMEKLDRLAKEQIRLEKEVSSQTGLRLADYLDHEELYKQYPEARNINFEITPVVFEGIASYTPGNNTIKINSEFLKSNPEKAKEAILHEIQHSIQEIEGFAKGGSPDMIQTIASKQKENLELAFIRDVIDDYRKKGKVASRSKIKEDVRKLIGGDQISDELISVAESMDYKTIKDNIDKLYKNFGLGKINDSDSVRLYKKLAGEVEARDVSARMGLSPEERIQQMPYSSQGINPKDQIVTHGENNVSNSMDLEGEARINKGEVKHRVMDKPELVGGNIQKKEVTAQEKLLKKIDKQNAIIKNWEKLSKHSDFAKGNLKKAKAEMELMKDSYAKSFGNKLSEDLDQLKTEQKKAQEKEKKRRKIVDEFLDSDNKSWKEAVEEIKQERVSQGKKPPSDFLIRKMEKEYGRLKSLKKAGADLKDKVRIREQINKLYKLMSLEEILEGKIEIKTGGNKEVGTHHVTGEKQIEWDVNKTDIENYLDNRSQIALRKDLSPDQIKSEIALLESMPLFKEAKDRFTNFRKDLQAEFKDQGIKLSDFDNKQLRNKVREWENSRSLKDFEKNLNTVESKERKSAMDQKIARKNIVSDNSIKNKEKAKEAKAAEDQAHDYVTDDISKKEIAEAKKHIEEYSKFKKDTHKSIDEVDRVDIHHSFKVLDKSKDSTIQITADVNKNPKKFLYDIQKEISARTQRIEDKISSVGDKPSKKEAKELLAEIKMRKYAIERKGEFLKKYRKEFGKKLEIHKEQNDLIRKYDTEIKEIEDEVFDLLDDVNLELDKKSMIERSSDPKEIVENLDKLEKTKINENTKVLIKQIKKKINNRKRTLQMRTNLIRRQTKFLEKRKAELKNKLINTSNKDDIDLIEAKISGIKKRELHFNKTNEFKKFNSWGINKIEMKEDFGIDDIAMRKELEITQKYADENFRKKYLKNFTDTDLINIREIADPQLRQEVKESIATLKFLDKQIKKYEKSIRFEKTKVGGKINEAKKKLYESRIWRTFQRKIADMFIELDYFVKRKDIKVHDDTDVYMKRRNYYGRVDQRSNLITRKIEEIDQAMIKEAKSIKKKYEGMKGFKEPQLKKEVQDYLIALHALERNKIHGDGASGMTNAEARKIRRYTENLAYSKELKSLSSQIQNINRDSLKLLHDSGIISGEIYKKLTDTYRNHVPLYRVMDDISDHDLVKMLDNQDISIKEKAVEYLENKKKGKYLTSGKTGIKQVESGFDVASGKSAATEAQKTLEVKDLLENINQNAQAAVMRSELNRINQASAKLFRENSEVLKGEIEEIKGLKYDEEYYDVVRAEAELERANEGFFTKKLLSERKKILKEAQENFDNLKEKYEEISGKKYEDEKEYRDHILEVRENGETKYFHIKDDILVRSFKGTGQSKFVKQLEQTRVLRTIGWFTNLSARLATTLNLTFGASNVFRDVQESFINTHADFGGKGAIKGLLQTPKSMGTLYKSINAGGFTEKGIKFMRENLLKKDHIEWKNAEDVKLYEQAQIDGALTGGFAMSTIDDITADINKIYKNNRNPVRKTTKYLIDKVEDFNDIMENSTRFSAYKTALEYGMSREQAAFFAKNSTVDFNKKGEWGKIINDLYMFSNATIQGTTRMAKSFTNPKTALKINIALASAVVMYNQWNSLFDEDWRDKLDDWELNSNIPIVLPWHDPNGESAILLIPIAHPLRPYKYAQQYAYDAASGKSDDNIRKVAGEFSAEFLSATMPLGGSDWKEAFVPHAGKIPYQLKTNTNFAGAAIAPEDGDIMRLKNKSDRYFQNQKDTFLGRMSISLAENIREKTGYDIEPQKVEYIFTQLGSGALRDGVRFVDTGRSLVTKEETKAKNAPILNRFISNRDPDQLEQLQYRKEKRKLEEEWEVLMQEEEKAVIIRWKDADTPEIMITEGRNKGEIGTIRMGNVDTPESAKAKEDIQEWSIEASIDSMRSAPVGTEVLLNRADKAKRNWEEDELLTREEYELLRVGKVVDDKETKKKLVEAGFGDQYLLEDILNDPKHKDYEQVIDIIGGKKEAKELLSNTYKAKEEMKEIVMENREEKISKMSEEERKKYVIAEYHELQKKDMINRYGKSTLKKVEEMRKEGKSEDEIGEYFQKRVETTKKALEKWEKESDFALMSESEKIAFLDQNENRKKVDEMIKEEIYKDKQMGERGTYGRLLRTVTNIETSENLNEAMVRKGYAIAYEKYTNEDYEKYKALQEEAIKNKRALWSRDRKRGEDHKSLEGEDLDKQIQRVTEIQKARKEKVSSMGKKEKIEFAKKLKKAKNNQKGIELLTDKIEEYNKKDKYGELNEAQKTKLENYKKAMVNATKAQNELYDKNPDIFEHVEIEEYEMHKTKKLISQKYKLDGAYYKNYDKIAQMDKQDLKIYLAQFDPDIQKRILKKI